MRGGYSPLQLTGGGSELPLVARRLREEFGRRVRRSAYTRSATAIGLAIQADASSGYTLHEVFSRNFGVWREGEGGRVMVFDVIFPLGTRLPAPGESPLAVRRRYRPVHNVGHFRYFEASDLDGAGQPAGDIAVWDEVWFPLDPALEGSPDLARASVEKSETAASQQIEAASATCKVRKMPPPEKVSGPGGWDGWLLAMKARPYGRTPADER